jgi:hypothetical protein
MLSIMPKGWVGQKNCIGRLKQSTAITTQTKKLSLKIVFF